MLHVIAYAPSNPNLIFADVRIASAKASRLSASVPFAFAGSGIPQ